MDLERSVNARHLASYLATLRADEVPRSYPTPHPYRVSGARDAQQWSYRTRPVATEAEFYAYMKANGQETTPEDYAAWLAEVKTVMAANARADRPKRSTAAAERVESPAVPATAMPTLPHLKARRRKPRLEAMNVRIPEDIASRLDAYLIRHRGVKKQEVVGDMLDAMLTAHGFPPEPD